MPYEETASDYNIRYKDTFLIYKEGVNRFPCKVVDFYNHHDDNGDEDSEIFARIKIYHPDEDTYKNKTVSIDSLVLKMWKRGCVNLSSSVIVLNECSPSNSAVEVKYKAGLSQSNTQVIDPFHVERSLVHSVPFSFENNVVLNATINNKYGSPEECLENTLSYKRLGQAFSPDYFFGLRSQVNAIMLHKREYIIGMVDPSNKQILLKQEAHPLYEEISEYGLTVKKV